MVDAMRDGVRLHAERAGSGPPLLVIGETGGERRHMPNVSDWPLTGFVLGVCFGGMAAQELARRHHDTWDRLRAITAPVLVCGGRYDGIAPPANSERIGSRNPAAELAGFEGGPAFLAQDRSAFPAVVDFLTHGA